MKLGEETNETHSHTNTHTHKHIYTLSVTDTHTLTNIHIHAYKGTQIFQNRNYKHFKATLVFTIKEKEIICSLLVT